ncbi:hypothetical protein CAP35_05495 [Chitinophagaceae bacterium IBVUCB1]|nr:hypothetical protein CAP35_05495 [Chitinophagaceae bacterium IBVUCB1]
MRNILRGIFQFLPLQLLVLHFRKYQLLLIFWAILIATITGHFAAVFGAKSLFLAPEYQGKISFFSMFILGGAMAVFVMAWHITTFIIHSARLPFLGAVRHAFIKYCINNSLLPLAFLVFYSFVITHYQLRDEHSGAARAFLFQVGFYTGFALIIIVSFAYFFRVDRDLLKVVLSRITNPSRIKNFIPYDALDYDIDVVNTKTFLSGRLRITHCDQLETYSPRLLHAVLRKHHRNAITANVFALMVLWASGFFVDTPILRLPAGAGFLILFSVVLGIVGAMKYFLRSWEVLGWIFIVAVLSALVKNDVFDVRSIAYGLNYKTPVSEKPVYNTENLNAVFTDSICTQDRMQEEKRLTLWQAKRMAAGDTNAPLIVVCVSGGGNRSAYWTFRNLQYLDSITNGRLYNNSVMITGASGGMLGAAYWRDVHYKYSQDNEQTVYLQKYQDNVGNDLLNAIIFSLASVDLASPFNKIAVAGYSYKKDRGYAMEQELIRNTEGLLDKKLGEYTEKEQNCEMPAIIVNGTIINDGKRLMVAASPVSYLCKPAYDTSDKTALVDAIDFNRFFAKQDAQNLRITSALRMNATFPYILPVVRLPSEPEMNVMDAGLRDNFGVEVAVRYLYNMRNWITANNKRIILLQIRDTRENELFPQSQINSLGSMVSSPLFVIQNKWESFQSYGHTYLKDYAQTLFGDKLHIVTMEYIPAHPDKTAALNFHLTQREKKDLLQSIYTPTNMARVQTIKTLLSK